MSTCSRRKVGALAFTADGSVWMGWNYMTAPECPRESSDAQPLVSSYTDGPTRCVAVHAERMALQAAWPEPVVQLLTTDEPCYQCAEMLQLLAVDFQVLTFGGPRNNPKAV